MESGIGPRRQRLLTAWRGVGATHAMGPGYDLTLPTRSERCCERLEAFIADPTEESFKKLWQPDALAISTEWVPDAVQNLWSYSLPAFADFLDELRAADRYNQAWESRLGWGVGIIHEVYSRTHPDDPIVSDEARRGLVKFGVDAPDEYKPCRERLLHFQELYERHAGHVTADTVGYNFVSDFATPSWRNCSRDYSR